MHFLQPRPIKAKEGQLLSKVNENVIINLIRKVGRSQPFFFTYIAMEKWKKIKEGNYEVSTLGNLKNIKTGKLVKIHNDSKGYKIVGLYFNGKRKTCILHRLIGEAFIENPDNKPFIDHINRVKNDNRIENLRWVTHLENMKNQSRGHITKEMIQIIIDLYNNGHSNDLIEKEINGL